MNLGSLGIGGGRAGLGWCQARTLVGAIIRGPHAGLVDLRVFDRLGKVAPFALEPRASSAAREHWLSVATYPMYSKGAVPLSQSRIRLASRGLNMEVEVTGEAAADSSPKRLLRGYVLDVSGVKKAMTGVAFDWDQQDHPLLVASIERGDDLDHWQPIATAVTLARLTAQGQTLLRNEIEFTAAPAKYLRVFVAQGEAPFRLAFGNARAQASALPIVSVVPGYGTDKAPVLSDAELGARQVLAGDSAKAERVAPRTWALWAALGAGVALLAWMALSLIRQLKAPKT